MLPAPRLAPLLAALAACSGSEAPPPTQPPSAATEWADAPPGTRVEIVGDLTDPATGRMKVRMQYSGLTDEMWSFKEIGRSPELTYHDVRFSTLEGRTIGYDEKGRTYELDGDPQPDVVIEYSVEPGGDGRHGLQGVVTDEFAVFDGRVFMFPNAAGGLRGGRLRFDAPAGWTVASALNEVDGWLLADVYGDDKTRTALAESCIGVGPFERTVVQYGSTEFRVFNFAPWPASERKKLNSGSQGVFGWFFDKLQFDPGFPVAMVWTPEVDGHRVYGGSSANGTCFEQPKARLRAWQLMAHRLGHSMNKYVPTGMDIRDDRDHWFKEGWASYVELIATVEGGVTPTSTRWNSLYNGYQKAQKRNPEWDVVLAEEPFMAGGDTTEFVHYTKGPLVVKLLDDWIQRRFGKDLTGFMAAMWEEYGRFQKPFPLREELEAWVGAPLDDFWSLYVDRRGFVYPVWQEALTPAVRKAADKPGAGTVAGRPVSGDYLYHLATSGDFERFADVVAFVEQEEARRIQLEAAGLGFLPPELEAVRPGLDDRARYFLALSQRDYPLLARPEPLEGGELILDPDDPDGRTLAQLLADEAAYEAGLGATCVEKIEMQRKNDDGKFDRKSIIAFGAGDRIRVQAAWDWVPANARIEASRAGAVSHTRTVSVAPDWTRSWSEFDSGRLPEGDGVVTFEVMADDYPAVSRSFWQRGG